MLEEHIKRAHQSLQLAAEMSEYYYHKPLIICYSGGKDSEIVLDMAKKCLSPTQFELVHNHTTIDAPETVYHVRKVFAEAEKLGIHTEVIMPTYKGERTSMWKLIEEKRMPPTRIARYCCAYLKEHSIPYRFLAFGIRGDEGPKRAGRDIFEKRGYNKASDEYRTLQHTYAMFQLDKQNKYEVYQCKLIEACKENGSVVVNPIYEFSDTDVWEYIRRNKVEVNPLYARGYKRVGCIGCPLGGRANQLREFEEYPQYKRNYILAFDRMQKRNEELGVENKRNLKTGKEWFDWWIGENPNQINLF